VITSNDSTGQKALVTIESTASLKEEQPDMKPRISMITLGVRDLERAVKFYGEGLGFPMMETSPGVAFFPLSGTWLSLYPREALAEDALRAAGLSRLHWLTTCSLRRKWTRSWPRLCRPAQRS